MDVVAGVGSAWERFDTDSITVGPTGDTLAKTVDFSFSNNFGTECIDVFTLAHADGCGNPQFPNVGYDGLTPDGSGLWNTQDQGPAVGRVPEPSTVALMGLGLLGFGWRLAKRRQS